MVWSNLGDGSAINGDQKVDGGGYGSQASGIDLGGGSAMISDVGVGN